MIFLLFVCIAVPLRLGEGRATPGPTEPWEGIPTYVTHRCFSIDFTLEPAALAPAPAAPTAECIWRIPPYDDSGTWSRVAEALRRELTSAAASPIRDPAAPLQASYDAFLASFDRALTSVLPPRPAGRVQEGGGADAAPPPLCPARRFRLYKGGGLPPPLVRLLKRKRHLRKCASKSEEAREATRTARRELRNLDRRRAAAHLDHAEASRVHTPHSFWKSLDRGFAPADPTRVHGEAAFIPDEEGFPSALQRFADAIRGMLGALGPTPPAMGQPDWHQYIPCAACPAMARLVEWEEVCRVLFPAMKGLPLRTCPADGGMCDSCTLCSDYTARHASWNGSPDNDGPTWHPHGQTSKASADRLHLEHFAWARPAAEEERMEYRRTVSLALAAVFNKALASGTMPEGSTVYRTIMLLKTAKPGVTQNLADPDDYRPITISKTVTKVLGLVLAARLTHWVVRERVVGEAQVGFMPKRGAEWHVWTLREVIKHRWRRKLDTYVLFVDLRKAYDSVDPRALLFVLERMGVPPRLVALLRHWSQHRQTTVTVNGVKSAPFNMQRGVGQGDVLSPLLFNLFIESLQRYLQAAVPGVAISRSLAIRCLLYADDIAIPCANPEAAQVALTAVSRWCEAWGLQLGIGKGKTEAVPFPAGRPRAGPPELPQPLLTPDGRQVPWALEYTYLGCSMRYDLSDSGLQARALQRMHAAEDRFFRYTSYVAKASPAVAFQVLNTAVAGSASYLLCLMEPNAKLTASMDRRLASAARKCQRVPSKVPLANAWLDARIPRATGLLMRERARLYLTLKRTPFRDAIAPRLFRFLRREARAAPAPRKVSRNASWVARTRALFTMAHQRWGVRRPSARHHWEVSAASNVYGRAVGLREWQEACLGGAQPTPSTVLQEPPGGPPRRHTEALLGGHLPQTVLLGRRPGVTPVSCRGPSCLGNLLALPTVRLPAEAVTRLVASRAGRMAFLFPPTVPPPWYADGRVAFRSASAWQTAMGPGCCPVCVASGAPHTSLHDWHLVTTCVSAGVVAERTRITAAMPSICASIFRHLLDASGYGRLADCCGTGVGEASPIRRLVVAVNWGTPAGRALLYRVVTVQPWPSSGLSPPPMETPFEQDPAMTVLWMLGCLLDNTSSQARLLRPLANAWCPWAVNAFERLALAWTEAAEPLDPCL